MLQRLWALVVKEFLAVWQDKKSRMMLIMPPLLQLLIFSWAATLDVTDVAVGILNLDEGKAGYELTQRFKGTPVFSKHLRFLSSADEIPDEINKQNSLMVISIDDDFSRKIGSGKPAQVQVILDGRKSNTAQIVQGYSAKILETFTEEINTFYGRPQQETSFDARNWFNPNLTYTWFTVTGLIAILTTLVGVAITSLSVAREREMGTFEQLLVSPLTPLDILLGKSIPAVIIGLIEGTVIFLAAITLYQIPFTGSLTLLYISMFVFIWSIVGVGLFISSLCQTQQQAILGVFVFMSPAVILSGYATPIDNMPPWLQQVTVFNPVRYFIYIVRGVVLKDLPAIEVWHALYPMILIAGFTLSAAAILFRKRSS